LARGRDPDPYPVECRLEHILEVQWAGCKCALGLFHSLGDCHIFTYEHASTYDSSQAIDERLASKRIVTDVSVQGHVTGVLARDTAERPVHNQRPETVCEADLV